MVNSGTSATCGELIIDSAQTRNDDIAYPRTSLGVKMLFRVLILTAITLGLPSEVISACWHVYNPTPNKITVFVQKSLPQGKGRMQKYDVAPGKAKVIHGVQDCLYDFFIRHHIGSDLIIDYGVTNVDLNSMLARLAQGGIDGVQFPEIQRLERIRLAETDSTGSNYKYAWNKATPTCVPEGYAVTPRKTTTACIGLSVGLPIYQCPEHLYPDPPDSPIPDLPNDSDEGQDEDKNGDESTTKFSYKR